jgi:hypothetical protein
LLAGHGNVWAGCTISYENGIFTVSNGTKVLITDNIASVQEWAEANCGVPKPIDEQVQN